MKRFQRASCLGFAIGTMVLAGTGSVVYAAGGPAGLDDPPRALSGPTIDIDMRQGTQSRAVPRPVSGNPLWAVPLSSLSVTRERPIFRQSRRPPAPAVAGQAPVAPVVQRAPPEPEAPQFALVGAVVGESEGIAIFLDQANSNAVIRLRVGEDHEGWVLHWVKGREAMLQRNGENVVFALPAPDSVSAPPAPALHGAPMITHPATPAVSAPPAAASVPSPPADSSGAMVYPTRPNDFAPYVPRSTPKNGEHDGL